MTVIFLMIPMALLLGAGFVAAFVASVNSGQFEDLETPALRILENDKNSRRKDQE